MLSSLHLRLTRSSSLPSIFFYGVKGFHPEKKTPLYNFLMMAMAFAEKGSLIKMTVTGYETLFLLSLRGMFVCFRSLVLWWRIFALISRTCLLFYLKDTDPHIVYVDSHDVKWSQAGRRIACNIQSNGCRTKSWRSSFAGWELTALAPFLQRLMP